VSPRAARWEKSKRPPGVKVLSLEGLEGTDITMNRPSGCRSRHILVSGRGSATELNTQFAGQATSMRLVHSPTDSPSR